MLLNWTKKEENGTAAGSIVILQVLDPLFNAELETLSVRGFCAGGFPLGSPVFSHLPKTYQ